jgi:signal peptide peptidase SppA
MKKKVLKISNESTVIATQNKVGQFFDNISSWLPFANKKNIAVLRLSGVIGTVGPGRSGLSIESINKHLEKAFSLPRLEAVCLNINSPGGSPVQSELIATRIIELSEKNNVPVYAFVEDMAASGGYFLASAAHKIYVSKSSIIGSIGVISRSFGLQELIKKIGIERRVYTQGKNKSILDPFVPEKEQDIKIINNLQNNIYNHFVDFVKTRRAGRLTQTDDILFNGDIWTGETAFAYGLVDGINNIYSFIKDNYDDTVNIKYITEKESWIRRKFGLSTQSTDIVDSLFDKLIEKIEHAKYMF